MKWLASLYFVLYYTAVLSGQSEQYKILTIGFYNLENLFDIENDPLTRDDDFTPEGSMTWTEDRYWEKQGNMAYAISQIGLSLNPLGVSVLGVAEVENRNVLEDLVSHELLAERKYSIIHYDSPDRRGVDVAMLYNPQHFTPLHHDTIPFHIYNDDGTRRYTRNILFVEGILDGDTIHVLVNHWPSRGGGESRTEPSRITGARLNRKHVDSLLSVYPHKKIFIMGDFNDDPTNKSIKDHLRAHGSIKQLRPGDLFNPMTDFYRRGQGSNAYRDSWSLFDQIIISQGLLDKEQPGYLYHKAFIFNPKFLVQPYGKYKGYPFRTFSFDKYQGGYSDHFPVYVHLVKKL